jgi:hypothetical protein
VVRWKAFPNWAWIFRAERPLLLSSSILALSVANYPLIKISMNQADAYFMSKSKQVFGGPSTWILGIERSRADTEGTWRKAVFVFSTAGEQLRRSSARRLLFPKLPASKECCYRDIS